MIPGDLTIFLNHLCKGAGEIARKHFRASASVETKQDNSPVTIADKEIEQYIRDEIGRKFPEHGIIGEEFAERKSSSPYSWIIDPIDGTRSFIAGRPLFTTLIGLLENGKPLAGAVYQPNTNELWIGITGKQSTLNGSPCSSSDISNLTATTFATTSPFLFEKREMPIIERLSAACRSTIYGGDAYNYASIASGWLELVVESGLKPYDFLPVVPVITGAGGIITDWQGDELDINSTGNVIAASNRALHSAALKILNGG